METYACYQHHYTSFASAVIWDIKAVSVTLSLNTAVQKDVLEQRSEPSMLVSNLTSTERVDCSSNKPYAFRNML